MWLLLILTLPSAPSAVRVRTWRALKAAGCAALRDGVYLLPERPDCAQVLAELAAAVQAAGGTATRLTLTARDAAQQAAFVALFDRSADYRSRLQDIGRARRALRRAAEPAARKLLSDLAQQVESVRRIDFFPTAVAAEAVAALDALRGELDARFSPGEPSARRGTAITRRDPADYRGRVWATRRRPWVDRLASAWLIRRFVDSQARIVWVASADKVPKRALGFDYDGAAFTHLGNKVTFEVLAASFGVDDDTAVKRIGEAVHYIDVGGVPSEEAAGLAAVVRGLQAQHRDDDALLGAACAVFDALYAGLRAETA